eukprot:jgi/Chlat1/9131/Chrsp97S08386
MAPHSRETSPPPAAHSSHCSATDSASTSCVDAFPVNTLQIGMWACRLHHSLSLFMIDNKRLVLFVDRTVPSDKSRRAARVRNLWLRTVSQHRSSPFAGTESDTGFGARRSARRAHLDRAYSGCLAFELDWASVVGLQYSNPLCTPGRLVLEVWLTASLKIEAAADNDGDQVKQLVKREFSTAWAAFAYYAPPQALPAAYRLPQYEVTSPTSSPDCRKTILRCRSASMPEAASWHEAGNDSGTDGDDWPSPSAWTATAAEYRDKTVVLTFWDPLFPDALRKVVASDHHLLKLYETGLPTWAVVLPSFGVYYRPWLRTVTAYLWIALSLFSFACGFYDLYKHVPYARAALHRVFGPVFITIADWCETHASLRLSVLVAFLMSKSPLMQRMLALSTSAIAPLRQAWMALVSTVGATCAPLLDIITTVLTPIRELLGFVFSVLSFLASVATDCLLALFWPFRTLAEILWGLLAASWEFLEFAGSTLWEVVQQVRVFITPLRRSVTSGVATARAVHSRSAGLPLLYAEVSTLWKELFSKLWRGLKAVLNGALTLLATANRHRLSYGLAYDRRKQSVHRRVHSALSRLQSTPIKLLARIPQDNDKDSGDEAASPLEGLSRSKSINLPLRRDNAVHPLEPSL